MEEVKRYFKETTKLHPKTTVNENILYGMPTIKGRRINISLIISCLKDGMTLYDIQEDFDLTMEEIQQAMSYMIDVLDKPYK